jgi:short-subunit dehydrogenase
MNKDSPYTLITGASQGIGRALSNECAKRNRNLLLVALPDSGLPDLARELKSVFNIDVEYLESDLTERDCHEKVHEFAETRGIAVNTLINNAGIGWNGIFENMMPSEIDQMIMLNLRATTLLTHIFIPDLLKFPVSYILNICSMASLVPLPGKSIYAATKAFIMFFSKALQSELSGRGVNITSVLPYGVLTNHVVKERISKSGFMARKAVMKPEDVARISLDGMVKGKKIIIPGSVGKAIYYAGFFTPQGLVLAMMEREIRKALK